MTTETCPWLGTDTDRDIHHAEPSPTHLCYAQRRPADIELEYQAHACLTARHLTCQFYREPPQRVQPFLVAPEELEEEEEEEEQPGGRPNWAARLLAWLFVLGLAAVVGGAYLRLLTAPPPIPTPTPLPPSPAPTATYTPTPSPIPPTPAPTYEFVGPTGTPTPYPGGSVLTLSPASEVAGWVASDEVSGNHLGDSYLYTGVFDGVIYHGVFQVDLSAVPRGAPIYAATLELGGLDGRRLSAGGAWEVRILAAEAGEELAGQSFQQVHNAPVEWALAPALAPADLAPGQANAWELDEAVRAGLAQRLMDEQYLVTFRLDGPISGDNNVFAWDTGYGAATQGARPRLLLSVGAPPETPVPTGTPQVVVVTSTPTPANVVTAAVLARTATAAAATWGPPTATSIYEWTPTVPAVVTAPPTPANQATADWEALVATAVALTTGTFTPTPDNAVTATPTRIWIPVEELTPTPTPPAATPLPPMPADLVGKILYRSDRAGGAGPWAVDADGGGVALLTAGWPYDVAEAREAYSPDGSQWVYAGRLGGSSAILVRRETMGWSQPLVVFSQGQVSSPVWSPAGGRIAFAGNVAGGSTQVWVVRTDGSGLHALTSGAAGGSHPSFSPDGRRIVYASGGADGQRQMWVINVDGSGRRRLSSGEYDEWDPVWAK